MIQISNRIGEATINAKRSSKKKKNKWVITSAWPYVNETPHLGNMIGSILSADVFARYLRLKGDEVVFVSGSDAHGTPISVEAIKLGIEPEELAVEKHAEIVKIFNDWNISFDNYTTTHNPIHFKFTQDFYIDVQKNGFVSEHEHEAYYCPEDDFFLPDRFVEGICPYCNTPGARGDQCDNPSCSKVLEPEELIEPYCKICLLKDDKKRTTPIKKKTKHWYLDIPKIQNHIKEFISANKIIPSNARSMCLNSIKKGLPPRSITRDLKWGIPAPFKGAESKVIYVWFEAVLGYISAVKEWAEKIKKQPDLFPYFWNDPETKTVFFIGKDNIVFHLLIFPSLIVGYNKDKPEELKFPMPYNVSSTEFLNYENDKFSKSRKVGIWNDEALEIAPVDYWRYSLVRNRPEGRDVYFMWTEFERNINELNDKIGNFIHRTLTFIHKRFDEKVPSVIELDEEDKKIVEIIKNAPNDVGKLIEKFRFKDAVAKIIEIAGEGNTYLNDKAPWRLMKDDKEKAGQIFNLCIQLSHCLAILLAPICPGSAELIYKNIGGKKIFSKVKWSDAGTIAIKEGQKIEKPIPIFQKYALNDMLEKFMEIRKSRGEEFHIPESVSGLPQKDEELEEGKKKKKLGDVISYKFFQKFKFKTVRIQKIEKISSSKSSKSIKIIGKIENKGTKEFITDIKNITRIEELIGNDLVYLDNFEGVIPDQEQGKGFLMNLKNKEERFFIITDKPVKPGSPIR